MSILKVSRLGHPVLRLEGADAVPEEIRQGRYQTLIDDMFETMKAYEGVGLAGPQVHLPLRVFVWKVTDEVARKRSIAATGQGVVFNATYTPASEDRVTDWEGCLSAPFLAGQVPRYQSIKVCGLGVDAEPFELTLDGYIARIFQHEIDHTEGHVYLDRMSDLRSLTYTIVL